LIMSVVIATLASQKLHGKSSEPNNVSARIVIGFGLPCDWLRKWRLIFLN